jgi:hypothetical protein
VLKLSSVLVAKRYSMSPFVDSKKWVILITLASFHAQFVHPLAVPCPSSLDVLERLCLRLPIAVVFRNHGQGEDPTPLSRHQP